MPTLYEYYNTGDTGHATVIWMGQTFTPAIAHSITRVLIKIGAIDGSPGDLTVSIRATSGGLPTGNDLVSATKAQAQISVGWNTFDFASSYGLSANVRYAIIFRSSVYDSSNRYWWRCDFTPAYAGGSFVSSADGVSWTSDTSYDFMFEEWGDPTLPTVTTQAIIIGV